jgi:hypothetical protein
MLKMQFSLLLVAILLTSHVFAQQKDLVQKVDQVDCSCIIDTSMNLPTIEELNGGNKILAVAQKMAIIDKDIVRGSCWDFVNEVYKRAGSSSNKKAIFRSKKGGPYANPSMVQPGDWIYHVNYEYKGIEHSAIFVCWKDFEKRIAITLSYAGMNRNQPAKYGTYNLKGIYSIFRNPTEKPISVPEETTGN